MARIKRPAKPLVVIRKQRAKHMVKKPHLVPPRRHVEPPPAPVQEPEPASPVHEEPVPGPPDLPPAPPAPPVLSRPPVFKPPMGDERRRYLLQHIAHVSSDAETWSGEVRELIDDALVKVSGDMLVLTDLGREELERL